jgi:tetratricopeptide (TPR) repeat protein
MFSSPIVIAILLVLEGPTTSSRDEARQHFNAGRELQTAGKYDQAIAEYEDAYRLAPLPELLFNMAQAYRLKGDRKRAIELYERYVTAVPEGSTSDEALEHIRTLKLEIEVQEAREASRRALEQSETIRKREEAQAAARLRAIESSTAAERDQRDAAERQKRLDERLEEAHTVGRTLRQSGMVLGITGLLEIGFSIPLGIALQNSAKQLQNNTRGWGDSNSTDLSSSIDNGNALANVERILATIGAVSLVGGVSLYASGKVAEARAMDKVGTLTLAPLIGPSSFGLALAEGF